MMVQKNEENYSFEKYVYPDRWISYWHQISETIKTKPERLLIIGKGDGIVESVLRRYIDEVKTLDIDKNLSPDFVSSVEKMPFQDNYFDTILCAEVLEHLPFEKAQSSMKEIWRICNNKAIISLPHFGPVFKFLFKIPLLGEAKISFKIPFYKSHLFKGDHHWELGKKGYSPRRVRGIINRYFKIENEMIPFENQYHHFFILKKGTQAA